MVGTQMTLLALPLTAVLVLHATPGQMGVLAAVEFAPFLLFGLVAGAWVDRLQAKRVMITADVARAVLLTLVPLGAATHVLSIVELLAVAFAIGAGSAFFDVAYLAIVPAIVGSDQLLAANARLEGSRAGAAIVGPGLAGPLVQLLTAPVVLLIDSVSFAVSALSLLMLRGSEGHGRRERHTNIRHDVLAGVRAVVHDPILRALAGCVSTFNLFSSVVVAIYVLYVTRTLGLNAALLGLITAVGGAGALAGASLVLFAGRRITAGRVIMAAALASAIGTIAIGAVRGSPALEVGILAAAQAVVELGVTATVVSVVSLRQSITPRGQEGMMSASMRFIIYGTVPLGALLGGLLGQTLGLRATVLVAAAGELLTPLWIALSPVWSMRLPRGDM